MPVIRTGWIGNLFESGDRFVNEEYPFKPRLKDVLKWKLRGNPQRGEKAHDLFRLEVRNDSSFVNEPGDCIVWLGHATFYIRLNGIVLLVDPVFYDLPFV